MYKLWTILLGSKDFATISPDRLHTSIPLNRIYASNETVENRWDGVSLTRNVYYHSEFLIRQVLSDHVPRIVDLHIEVVELVRVPQDTGKRYFVAYLSFAWIELSYSSMAALVKPSSISTECLQLRTMSTLFLESIFLPICMHHCWYDYPIVQAHLESLSGNKVSSNHQSSSSKRS